MSSVESDVESILTEELLCDISQEAFGDAKLWQIRSWGQWLKVSRAGLGFWWVLGNRCKLVSIFVTVWRSYKELECFINMKFLKVDLKFANKAKEPKINTRVFFSSLALTKPLTNVYNFKVGCLYKNSTLIKNKIT